MAQNGNLKGNGTKGEVVLQVRGLTVTIDNQPLLEDLDIDLHRGEILGVVGGSGTGKTVLLRSILGLLPKQSGAIEFFGVDIDKASFAERSAIDRRLGVLFQQGALFSSLNVLQNIQVPMREHLRLSPRLMDELARLKLDLVGLPDDTAEKFPSELSGGMTKRASLARALALDPEIIFLDEPTSGLDPISAGEIDKLIATLQDTLGIAVYMVTHDLDSLHDVCDRIAVLGDKRVLVDGTMEELVAYNHPWVQSYFRGPRARHVLA